MGLSKTTLINPTPLPRLSICIIEVQLCTGSEVGVEAQGGKVGVEREGGPRQVLRGQQANKIAVAGQVPVDKISLECSKLQLIFLYLLLWLISKPCTILPSHLHRVKVELGLSNTT